MVIGLPTFDIETTGWVTPTAVGFFDGYSYHEFIKENKEDDVIWRFLTTLGEHFQGIKLYAHCASKFDNKFILSSLCQHGEEALLEAGLIRLRWKGPNITFEDSYPLIPLSLKRANIMFGVEEKKEWDHEKGLSPWEMGESLGAFREYLKRDCLSLSNTLHNLCELLGCTFGATPSISLSTTSAKIFNKCFYNLNEVDSNEEFEGFIRPAIYGGRNEVYRRYGENINHYDVRLMYVSCYNTPVPIGKLRWTIPSIDKGTLVEATVKIPSDMYIGPLPYKLRDRLVFPVGEFSGWWDIQELRNSVKIKGVDLTIRRQLECEEAPIMEGFGNFVGHLRNGTQSDYWKMFGISLSGKFGQSRWRDIIKHFTEIRNMEGYTPIGIDETYFQTKEYVGGKTPYIKPAIAMRIRAEARVRHLNLLLEAQKEGDLFYCDTDSIFTTATLPIGDNKGELAFLGRADRGYFIKQKLYGLIGRGKLTQKSAGYSDLKLNEEDFRRLLEWEEVEVKVESMPSYRKILRAKEVKLLERTRALIKEQEANSRIPLGLDSKPPVLPLSLSP